jgi:hypothetical protein
MRALRKALREKGNGHEVSSRLGGQLQQLVRQATSRLPTERERALDLLAHHPSATGPFGKPDKQHRPDGFFTSHAHIPARVCSLTYIRSSGFVSASFTVTPKQ